MSSYTLGKKNLKNREEFLIIEFFSKTFISKKSSFVGSAKIIVLMSGGWINICQLTQEKHRIIKKIMILTVNIRVSYGKICTPCFGLFCVFCVYFFSRDLDIFPLHQSLKFPVSTEARV